VVSGHSMVVAGAVEALALFLHRKGRLILPSPSEAMWNYSTESSVMARSGDDVPPRVEPMTAAPEPSPMGEGLRPTKRPALNSRLPK
jgi:hypothetical protein